MYKKKEHHSLNSLVVCITLFFISQITACTIQPYEAQKAWIDAPFQNSRFSAGSVIQLVAHVSAENGVAEVGVFLDNEPISRGSPVEKGKEFSVFSQSLIIDQPGIHDISVVAYDSDGNASRPAFVQVEIFGEKSEPIAPSPTATVMESQPEPVTIADMEIDFWADAYSLQSGECTNLHWIAASAESVTLQGQPISVSGSQNICPSQTTTYNLVAESSGKSTERNIVISVQIPEPTETPEPQDSDPPEYCQDQSHSTGDMELFHLRP